MLPKPGSCGLFVLVNTAQLFGSAKLASRRLRKAAKYCTCSLALPLPEGTSCVPWAVGPLLQGLELNIPPTCCFASRG